jgi:UDP-MurNAc hydroxylase
MQIQFINHASVKLITSQVRITSDPWYSGAAFNNGWDLMSSPAQAMEWGSDATHFWLSHEHPDHFSVGFFKSTPNRGARVLFQKTADQRVASFLRSQRFAVDEIPERESFEVAPGETMRIGRDGFYDSWNVFRADGRVILNINDCELKTEHDLLRLRADLGPIDVLLTQFSYAAWKGGKANKALRELAAKEKLATVQRQIKCLQPKYVIPFASFVYFSHVENFYLNDSVNQASDAAVAIEAAGSIPVIMKPGDVWTVGAAWDNADAVAFWRNTVAAIDTLPRHEVTKPVPLPELVRHCEQYQQKVFKKNAKWLIKLASITPAVGAFRPLTIRLTDIDKTVRFSFFEELREAPPGSKPDAEMSSESLDFIFLNEFGYDTLSVNGRFEASGEGFARMTKNFAVGSLNALGMSLRPSLVANADVILLLAAKLVSFRKRMERAGVAQR